MTIVAGLFVTLFTRLPALASGRSWPASAASGRPRPCSASAPTRSWSGPARRWCAALLSVAAGDWKSLPDPEVLEALKGYTLLRTDQNGWMEIETNRERMWVEVERE